MRFLLPYITPSRVISKISANIIENIYFTNPIPVSIAILHSDRWRLGEVVIMTYAEIYAAHTENFLLCQKKVSRPYLYAMLTICSAYIHQNLRTEDKN